jgi:hypothetical protein
MGIQFKKVLKEGVGYSSQFQYDNELDVRDAIRNLERELGIENEIHLPSEDKIMDNPGKFSKKMQQALELLEKLRQAKEEYESFDVF